jgi:flagellar basal body-associated protein FliL
MTTPAQKQKNKALLLVLLGLVAVLFVVGMIRVGGVLH